MSPRFACLALAVALAVALALGCHHSPGGDALPTARGAAPGFAGATAWLNVDRPLTLDDLHGRVVVVDFWTSCCVNCIHTLPILEQLEHKLAGWPLVVVEVHSAKFDAEKDRARLREIIAEYGIDHPVAIDGSMTLWNAWKIHAWPTLLVLDAGGHIVWQKAGESTPGELETQVTEALDRAKAEGTLVEKKIDGLHPQETRKDPLLYPGKVAVLADGMIAISDTGHHRIVLARADGTVTATIGSGLRGFTDGAFETATFNRPEGVAESGEILYVADTENHAIRAIDRAARTVTTVAGTGELGQGALLGASPAKTTKLRSPWDLVSTGGVVYVALAGSHQIAALSPASGSIAAFAGDGEERRVDGSGVRASFAQPSGLSTDGTSLYVADSESSSIRQVILATGEVKTLVGQDLFVFGDQDGPAPRVRLEHPLGVAYGRGSVWITDTYNSKLKRLDLSDGQTRTLVGGRDREVLFEPEGLAFHEGEIVVADTKHDRIVRVSAATGIVTLLDLHGLSPPASGIALAAHDKSLAVAEVIDLGDVAVAGQVPTALRLSWKTPPGTGVNEEAPFRLEWTTSDGLVSAPEPMKNTGAAVARGFDVTLEPTLGVAGGRLGGEMSLVLCDVATHLVCVPVHRRVELAFRIASPPIERKTIEIPLPQAKP
jgi:thiol-disulfide isomerase/thioredoxin